MPTPEELQGLRAPERWPKVYVPEADPSKLWLPGSPVDNENRALRLEPVRLERDYQTERNSGFRPGVKVWKPANPNRRYQRNHPPWRQNPRFSGRKHSGEAQRIREAALKGESW